MSDSFISGLRAVVRQTQHLQSESNSIIELTEDSPLSSLKVIYIDGRGCNDVFAFTLDVKNGGSHEPLSYHTSKAGSSKWNKVCDGVFVWRNPDDGILRILLCDLKSSAPSGSEWKHQLQSSSCFVKYLLEIVRQFCGGCGHEGTPLFHAFAFHGAPAGRNKRGTAVKGGNGYPTSSLSDPQRVPVTNRASLMLRALCQC